MTRWNTDTCSDGHPYQSEYSEQQSYFSNILQHLGNIQLVIHCNTFDHSLTFRHSVSLDHSAILAEEMPLFSARILILG